MDCAGAGVVGPSWGERFGHYGCIGGSWIGSVGLGKVGSRERNSKGYFGIGESVEELDRVLHFFGY